MRRYIILPAICVLLVSFATSAQTLENVVESHCENGSYELFEDLTPVLVVASGYDCGICQWEAPDVAAFANEHVGELRVWGAMHYNYSSETPSCGELDDWVSSYSWGNVQAFNDVNNGSARTWALGGYPSYQVVDVANKKVVYRGFNLNQAEDSVLAVSARITSLKSEIQAEDYFLVEQPIGGDLEITILKSGFVQLSETTGEVLTSQDARAGDEVRLPTGDSGRLILFNFLSADGLPITQKILTK